MPTKGKSGAPCVDGAHATEKAPAISPTTSPSASCASMRHPACRGRSWRAVSVSIPHCKAVVEEGVRPSTRQNTQHMIAFQDLADSLGYARVASDRKVLDLSVAAQLNGPER